MSTGLLDRSKLEIKLGDYAVGSATSMLDATAQTAAQDYRRQVASRMMPLGKDEIREKIPSGEYHVSLKVDGEFTVIVFEGGEAFSVNPGGTVRIGLPWIVETAELLKKAGVESAMIAGELYVHNDMRRPRVHDVTKIARGPKSESELKKLRFAAFDLISLDGEPAGESYGANFQTLENLFAKGKRVHTVEMQIVSDHGPIKQLFEDWVEGQGAEGLVVRNDTAGQFKVKPRHTLDAVVIGFTESTNERQGLLHDLLVAVMRQDGSLHVLTRVGGGFSDVQRQTMLSDLKDMTSSSEYVEVNSDYVAYQMVRPEWVVEISCLDLVSQTTRGGNVNRMVVSYSPESGYEVVRRLPLATVISPQFVRMREDKSVGPNDIRITQVSERVEVALFDADAKSFALPAGEIVKRQVFTKILKGSTMVRKFVLIRTNKEKAGDEFPAYVLHYTDFSPNRKEPLAREVVVSNSETQIQSIYLTMRETNIKKGWSEHSG